MSSGPIKRRRLHDSEYVNLKHRNEDKQSEVHKLFQISQIMHSVSSVSNCEFPSKFIAHRGLASCTTFLVLTCLKQVSSFDEKDLHTFLFDGHKLHAELYEAGKLSSARVDYSEFPRYIERDSVYLSNRIKGKISGFINCSDMKATEEASNSLK